MVNFFLAFIVGFLMLLVGLWVGYQIGKGMND